MWRRSSRSGDTGNCVEVRGDLAGLRDSKHPDVALPVRRAAVAKLITFARASGR
jgi:hypothetical protein